MTDAPKMYDTNWSDYALSHFEPDELIEGNPTTDGLRRVVHKLLGPVIVSESKVVEAPTPQNDNHATVSHTIHILWLPQEKENDIRIYTDVADVYMQNTKPEFSVYSTATAATRAEGRALRKALRLKRVIAAEEAANIEIVAPNKINNGQISLIKMLCERHNINVNKLINMGRDKYKTIQDVPYGTAVLICKLLNQYQTGEKPIPEGIKL